MLAAINFGCFNRGEGAAPTGWLEADMSHPSAGGNCPVYHATFVANPTIRWIKSDKPSRANP